MTLVQVFLLSLWHHGWSWEQLYLSTLKEKEWGHTGVQRADSESEATHPAGRHVTHLTAIKWDKLTASRRGVMSLRHPGVHPFQTCTDQYTASVEIYGANKNVTRMLFFTEQVTIPDFHTTVYQNHQYDAFYLKKIFGLILLVVPTTWKSLIQLLSVSWITHPTPPYIPCRLDTHDSCAPPHGRTEQVQRIRATSTVELKHKNQRNTERRLTLWCPSIAEHNCTSKDRLSVDWASYLDHFIFQTMERC